MFKSLKNILEKKIKKIPQKRAFLSLKICDLFEEKAKQVLGQDSVNFKATSFEDGTIFVKAPSASLRQELNLYQNQIIETLNQELEKEIVERIRYRS